ncbi:DUF3251 domain-containing protein [Enterobacter chuandaensis]|uniref:DUF3251 domain-containing protein n=1 Tax=Enterobacter chuandaensis TaxID=2497875 RepID=UPI0009B232B8
MLRCKLFTYSVILLLPLLLSSCEQQKESVSPGDLKEQQQSLQEKLDKLDKQQQTLVNNEKIIAEAIGNLDARVKASTFTELDPSQTRFFVLNNGSIGLAGHILSISPTTDGSILHISLVNLLSVRVANIGFQMTWGNERPKTKEALPRWQQLLFSTKMDSDIEFLPGQWKNIDLTLKGVSPNNLKYLKMSLNMDNLIFGSNQASKSEIKKTKK